MRTAIEFQKGVAMAAGAMTKVRALAQRTCVPCELATPEQQMVQFCRVKRCVGEGRHHAWSAVTVLAKVRRLAVLDGARRPGDFRLGPPGGEAECLRDGTGDLRALYGLQPGPAAKQRDHVSGISMHRAQPRSEEHTSELQSPDHLVCRLLLEK